MSARRASFVSLTIPQHVLAPVAEGAFVVAGTDLVIVVPEVIVPPPLAILAPSIGAVAVPMLVAMLPSVQRAAILASPVGVPVLCPCAVDGCATAQLDENGDRQAARCEFPNHHD